MSTNNAFPQKKLPYGSVLKVVRQDKSKSADGEGICAIPLEGFSECDGSQAFVDNLMTKMMIAVACVVKA